MMILLILLQQNKTRREPVKKCHARTRGKILFFKKRKTTRERLFDLFSNVVWRVALRHDAGWVSFQVFPSNTIPAAAEAVGAAAFSADVYLSHIF